MSSSIPEQALAAPESRSDAIAWIKAVIAWIGSRFDPGESFSAYGPVRHEAKHLDLTVDEIKTLDHACAATVALLGERARDLAYREAAAYLDRIDGEADASARPVTQPPPRWWLVERPAAAADSLDPARGLAFEDHQGIWWIWEPATEMLYNDTPWLFTEFYHEAAAQRDQLVAQLGGAVRFTQLSPRDAVKLIDEGSIGGGAQRFIPRRHAQQGLNLNSALACLA